MKGSSNDKKLEFHEVRPNAFAVLTRDRLVEAVKVWVDEAGGQTRRICSKS